MRKLLSTTIAAAAVAFAAPALAGSITIDLTHPIPTFHPTEGDPTAPDLNRPWLDSVPIPSFGQQAVFSISEFPTSQGHFDLGRIILSEHHGTHLDTPGHYINNEGSMEAGGAAPGERKLAHQLTSDDLIGPAVVIDISGRVQAELDKNGGMASADRAVTDFSNGSGNVVGADDIDAVADRIADGVFLVLNLGWSDFFFQGTDFVNDPYINGFNHPGMNKEAVDRLIEIMDVQGREDRRHRRRQHRHRQRPERHRRRRQVDQLLSRPYPPAAARRPLRGERDQSRPGGDGGGLHHRGRRAQACARHRRAVAGDGDLLGLNVSASRAHGGQRAESRGAAGAGSQRQRTRSQGISAWWGAA